jgi:hypothetical protein
MLLLFGLKNYPVLLLPEMESLECIIQALTYNKNYNISKLKISRLNKQEMIHSLAFTRWQSSNLTFLYAFPSTHDFSRLGF